MNSPAPAAAAAAGRVRGVDATGSEGGSCASEPGVRKRRPVAPERAGVCVGERPRGQRPERPPGSRRRIHGEPAARPPDQVPKATSRLSGALDTRGRGGKLGHRLPHGGTLNHDAQGGRQTQKDTRCGIPWIGHVQNRLIYGRNTSRGEHAFPAPPATCKVPFYFYPAAHGARNGIKSSGINEELTKKRLSGTWRISSIRHHSWRTPGLMHLLRRRDPPDLGLKTRPENQYGRAPKRRVIKEENKRHRGRRPQEGRSCDGEESTGYCQPRDTSNCQQTAGTCGRSLGRPLFGARRRNPASSHPDFRPLLSRTGRGHVAVV